MFGLGEGAAIHQDGAIGWGETMKAGQEEQTTVDVSEHQQRASDTFANRSGIC